MRVVNIRNILIFYYIFFCFFEVSAQKKRKIKKIEIISSEEKPKTIEFDSLGNYIIKDMTIKFIKILDNSLIDSSATYIKRRAICENGDTLYKGWFKTGNIEIKYDLSGNDTTNSFKYFFNKKGSIDSLNHYYYNKVDLKMQILNSKNIEDFYQLNKNWKQIQDYFSSERYSYDFKARTIELFWDKNFGFDKDIIYFSRKLFPTKRIIFHNDEEKSKETIFYKYNKYGYITSEKSVSHGVSIIVREYKYEYYN